MQIMMMDGWVGRQFRKFPGQRLQAVYAFQLEKASFELFVMATYFIASSC